MRATSSSRQRKRYLASTSSVCLSVFILGCGGSGGGNTAAAVPVVSPTPQLGPLGVVEDRAAGLVGLDANANGIRDDIDALIANKFSMNLAIKKMAEQNARAIQTLMIATNRTEVLAAEDALFRAVDCKHTVLPDASDPAQAALRNAVSDQLEGLTANTPARLKAYQDADALAGGSVIHFPTGQVCD